MSATVTNRRVRLFRSRYNQALRIPRDFELPGDEAIISKEGNRLIVEPVKAATFGELLMQWEPIAEAFPEIEDSPPDSVEL